MTFQELKSRLKMLGMDAANASVVAGLIEEHTRDILSEVDSRIAKAIQDSEDIPLGPPPPEYEKYSSLTDEEIELLVSGGFKQDKSATLRRLFEMQESIDVLIKEVERSEGWQ